MARDITVRHQPKGARRRAAEVIIRHKVDAPGRFISHPRTMLVCRRHHMFGDTPKMEAKPIDTVPIKYTWGHSSGFLPHKGIHPRMALKTSPHHLPASPRRSVPPKAEPPQRQYIKIQCQEEYCPYGKKPCIFNELEPIGFHGRLHFRCKCKYAKGSPPKYVDVVVKEGND